MKSKSFIEKRQGEKRKVKVKLLSCVQLAATPWTAAYQAPLSMGFSRQEYWSRVPLSSAQLWGKFPSNMSNHVSRGHCLSQWLGKLAGWRLHCDHDLCFQDCNHSRKNTVNSLSALQGKHVTCTEILMATASHVATHNFKKGGKVQPYHDPGDRKLEILVNNNPYRTQGSQITW